MKARRWLAFHAGIALALATTTTVKPRTVSLEIGRRSLSDRLDRERAFQQKRADTVTAVLDNEETLYFANITLGSPAQSLRLHLDTGSSDLWVNTVETAFCARGNTCTGGIYDPDASTSLKIVNDKFNISYVDGTGASGNYVSDILSFGGVTVDAFQFGLGTTSTSAEGILGIGYVSNEVQVRRAGLSSYPNLPQALKNSGSIARNAYSLWLDDQEASTGTILFGGVNSGKYQGDLATIPVVKTSAGYSELIVALTAVSMNGEQLSSNNLPAGALLDSGSTLTYLPNDIVSAIYQQVDASYSAQSGIAYVSCSLAQQSGTIEFTFSGKVISVALEEMVIPTSSNAARGRGQQSCVFGIAPTTATYSVMGDTFLRSAYVVYDLENNQISLAQTVFNSTAENVQEIPSGTSLPPGATAVPSPVTSVVSGSDGSASNSGGSFTGSATGFCSPSYLMMTVAAFAALLMKF